jgi:Flp pilus assembly CpaE family ATPase
MSAASRRIGVLGTVGGCGATTVACALALLWGRDRATRLIDLDLAAGDIAARWGVRCGRTVADLLLIAGELAPDLVARAEYPLVERLALVGAPERLPAPPPSDAAVRELVLAMGDGVHAVVDLGSRADHTALAALAATQRGLIVAPPTVRAVRRARTIADAVAPVPCDLVLCEGATTAELGPRTATRLSGLAVLIALPRSSRAAAAVEAGRRPGGRRRFARAIGELGAALA